MMLLGLEENVAENPAWALCTDRRAGRWRWQPEGQGSRSDPARQPAPSSARCRSSAPILLFVFQLQGLRI